MTQNRTTQIRALWPTVIFGTHPVNRVVSSGLFRCPKEQTERAYSSHKVRNWHTVFSVPVLPGRVSEEYVECFCCGATWDPRIIRSNHPSLRAG